jgi:hypothetical protein
MKLHSAVQDQAIVSNVASTGEFRIRNSAKAFSILSSGLYANKIRAIIRELSCNAVDSHTAAGRAGTPFDVHLPTMLEPWFSVRDYGTGLDHDQVTNIYTTYFESTKTASNEFIGALGLGSKSPFSYTDNFTVTAIRAGRKGIYTAFINDAGVPSIALMSEQTQTNEPDGVEVRFAVSETQDFNRFRVEARRVYQWFANRPVISGVDLEINDLEYLHRDIVPGVHQLKDSHQVSYHSVAVMGNIAYPIEIPNSDHSLGGDLLDMLKNRLEIHFDIGQLDFQASREGLSYIPQTVAAIKDKLESLRDALTVTLAQSADAIDNMWTRAVFLEQRLSNTLWRAAVKKYCADTQFELFDPHGSSWARMSRFHLSVDDLATQFNIVVRGFTFTPQSGSCVSLSSQRVDSARCVPLNVPSSNSGQGLPETQAWIIQVSDQVKFVINDTRIGALERSKYHWRQTGRTKSYVIQEVLVLDQVDRNKPMELDKFWATIKNPPDANRLLASQLQKKPSAVRSDGPVSVLRLDQASRGWSGRGEPTWKEAGNAATFDATNTYYYLPLSGYSNLGKYTDVKNLYWLLHDSKLLDDATIYGVRKSDIKWVQTQKNWVDLDQEIIRRLSQLDADYVMRSVKNSIDWDDLYCYNAHKHVTDPTSPYLALYNQFAKVKAMPDHHRAAKSFRELSAIYSTDRHTLTLAAMERKYEAQRDAVIKRYPLLNCIGQKASVEAVAQYINLIDSTQGV